MRRFINPDEKYDRERERRFFGSNRTYTPSPPYRPKLYIPEPKPEPTFHLPRIGICGWYEDDTELVEALDAVYGKGNWQIGPYLKYRDHHGKGQDTDYRVKHYRNTGRYSIFDVTKD